MTRDSQPDVPEWVARRTLPAETADGLREAVVHDLMATAGADCGLYHGVFLANGEYHFHDMRVFGDRQRMAFLEECSGRPVSEFMDLTVSIVSRVNGFAENTIDEIGPMRMYEMLWRPMQTVSVVCMNAVVEGTHVGWVGAQRVEGQPFFGPKKVALLGPRVDAYVHCLGVASQLEGTASRVRGLLFFDRAGEIRFTCESGRQWISSSALIERLRAEVASPAPREVFSAHDAIVRITPISGASGALFCVELAPTDEWRIPEIARLPVQKRRVAELAAFGATATEIARHLEISAFTVRSHLKEVYKRLGIASRVELAEHVQSISLPSSPR